MESVNIINNQNENKIWKPSTKIKINPNLPNKDKIKIKELVDRYWMIYAKKDQDIGILDEEFGEHDIILNNEKPVRQKTYKIPFTKEQVVSDCSACKETRWLRSFLRRF